MSITRNATFVDRPISVILEFATTPGNRPRYHPNSLGVSGMIDRPVQVGDVTRERASLMGHEGDGDWVVTAVEATYQVCWAIANPNFKAVLTDAFESQDAGTQFTQILAYDASAMTADVHEVFEWYMQQESQKAVQNLKHVLELQIVDR